MTTLVQYKLLLILIKHEILFENEHLQKASTKKICMYNWSLTFTNAKRDQGMELTSLCDFIVTFELMWPSYKNCLKYAPYIQEIKKNIYVVGKLSF